MNFIRNSFAVSLERDHCLDFVVRVGVGAPPGGRRPEYGRRYRVMMSFSWNWRPRISWPHAFSVRTLSKKYVVMGEDGELHPVAK